MQIRQVTHVIVKKPKKKRVRKRHNTIKSLAWTKERSERLKFLWNETGIPLKVIAEKLGVSEGSITGKRHRLKLPTRVKKASLPSIQALNALPVKISKKHGIVGIPMSEGYTIQKIERGMCYCAITPHNFKPRQHRFCGESTGSELKSYCLFHHHIMYPTNVKRMMRNEDTSKSTSG